MNTKKLADFFVKEKGKGGLTWIEIIEKFNVSLEVARSVWHVVNHMKLKSQTIGKDGEILFEKYVRTPEEQETPAGSYNVKKYTTYNGKPTWVTHEKIVGISNKTEFIEIINSLDFKKEKFKYKPKQHSDDIIFTFTDVHLGMSSEGNLFDLDWCIEKYYKQLDVMISHIPKNKNVIFAMLGDFTDGMKSRTNRGGHLLKQNMSDKEMFKNGIESMIYLLDAAAKISGNVKMLWIANSNHPGVTDYAIGLAIKNQAADRYENVEVDVLEDSFTHINLFEKDFILTHGYDEEYMKRGLPRFFSHNEINKIRNVRDAWKLEQPIMLRGDLHQNHQIDYFHFTDSMTKAFSPPSGWISTNFFSADPGGFKIISQVNGHLQYTPIDFLVL